MLNYYSDNWSSELRELYRTMWEVPQGGPCLGMRKLGEPRGRGGGASLDAKASLENAKRIPSFPCPKASSDFPLLLTDLPHTVAQPLTLSAQTRWGPCRSCDTPDPLLLRPLSQLGSRPTFQSLDSLSPNPGLVSGEAFPTCLSLRAAFLLCRGRTGHAEDPASSSCPPGLSQVPVPLSCVSWASYLTSLCFCLDVLVRCRRQ